MNRNVLSRRGAAGVALAAVAAIVMAGCNSGETPGNTTSQAPKLSGSVVVDGSSTVAPLSEAAADIYKEVQSGVQVSVGTSGTGGGFEKFCKGETDISDASRKIKETEAAKCKAAGIEYVELIVANDALSVVVHKDNNWIECITTANLKKVWDQGSTVSNWNQIDPSYPNEPLKLFGPGTDSGTFDYFTGAINGTEKRSRPDYTASENDNVLVQGVSGSKGGMGYFGFTYFEENASKLKALKVDGGSGCVTPSVASAQDGSYKPLARPLFIYVSKKSISGKPQVVDFVKYYVQHIDEIVKEAKYVPLTAAQKTTLTTTYNGAL